MVMKDKLYKNNKKRNYYFFRKVGVFFTVIATASIILAIPLSVYLLSRTEAQTSATIQQVAEDTTTDKTIIEITYDLKK